MMAEVKPLAPGILCSTMEIACSECSHEYILDLAGLSASTDVVCPGCNYASRMGRPELRRTLRKFEKGLNDIRNGGFSAEVVSAAEEANRRVAAGKAKPEKVAITYPIERGTRHSAHQPTQQTTH